MTPQHSPNVSCLQLQDVQHTPGPSPRNNVSRDNYTFWPNSKPASIFYPDVFLSFSQTIIAKNNNNESRTQLTPGRKRSGAWLCHQNWSRPRTTWNCQRPWSPTDLGSLWSHSRRGLALERCFDSKGVDVMNRGIGMSRDFVGEIQTKYQRLAVCLPELCAWRM